MIVTVFRSRLRPDADSRGYHELAAEMELLARTMPGFMDFKTFTAADGERVSIVAFDNAENHQHWRDHPDHRAAQRRGREDFYTDYRIVVGEVVKEVSFAADRRLS